MSHSLETIQKGVFDALLLNDSLLRLHHLGIDVLPKSQTSKEKAIEVEDFSPRVRFQAAQMQEAYVAFYCLENAARELICQRLLERHGTNWWNLKVPKKIKDYVESIKQKEAKNKYLGSRAVANIGYTLFGHLADVVTSCWDDFSDLFPEQAWVTSRFKDLEMCRNVIMHTNTLPEAELDRINSIARDWLSQVG